MSLTRRTLLQRTSLALASLSLSQMGLSLLTRRYQRVLATPTSRKLALLIGINDYPESVCGFSAFKGSVLQGALTDVELFKQLLVSRFGFNPADIITLVNGQATRDRIETALQFHLLDQVKAGDVVVFHCSGLGSYIKFPSNSVLSSDDTDLGIYPAFVPADGKLPVNPNSAVNDLMLNTVALFLGALPTSNLVSVLDCGYGASTVLLGNLRVRSRLTIPTGRLPDTTVDLHQRLKKQQWQPHKHKTTNVDLSHPVDFWPGGLLAAANPLGVSVEAPWDGYSAGLLTYALVQKLWWASSSPSNSKILQGEVISAVEKFVGESYRPTSSRFSSLDQTSELPLAGLPQLIVNQNNADGVVTEIETDSQAIKLWLGGLPPLVVQYAAGLSYFNIVEPSKFPAHLTEQGRSTLLQVRSRTGLVAKAKVYAPAQSSSPESVEIAKGMYIHETVRVISKDVSLIVALGNQLERIERVDATSALSALFGLKSVVVGEQQADCVFDKTLLGDISLIKALKNNTEGSSPSRGNMGDMAGRQLYGIFQSGRNMMEGTGSFTDEAVKTAIRRITPQLYALLADKLLQLTVSQGSSHLGVQVTLESVAPLNHLLGHQDTARSPWESPEPQSLPSWNEEEVVPTVAVGYQLRCSLHNYGDRPLYGLLVNIDSRGDATILYSFTPQTEEGVKPIAGEILPDTTVSVPAPAASFPWTVRNSLGLSTTYVILSCAPFTGTIAYLAQLVPQIDKDHRPEVVPQPLATVQAILQDLHNASRPTVSSLGVDVGSDRHSLHVDCWATFSFNYRVVTNIVND